MAVGPSALEVLAVSATVWAGRRVLVTGHTGFKGSWLSLWLQHLGARVHGFALPPEPGGVHELAGVGAGMAASVLADLRDAGAVAAALREASPELVFHLAAQPLVRASYDDPAGTFATNVTGTVHLLEAVRACPSVRAVVVVTTDKCYANREWDWAYRETDALGGHDPYSSSKACAELVAACWRDAFLRARGVALATARAGNVIGGGDLAADRLVPDLLRAVDSGEPLRLRARHAVRPWQHVLEPLSGYLTLGEALLARGEAFAAAFNFGPAEADARRVGDIVDWFLARHPGLRVDVPHGPQPHEAGRLRLDTGLARARLGWQPRWSLEQALERTVAWHRAWRGGADLRAFTLAQVEAFGPPPPLPEAA